MNEVKEYPLRVSMRRGLSGLLSLREDWARLNEHNEHYFLEFNWFLHAAQHDFRPVEELSFAVVKDLASGAVVAVVPLESRVERIRRVPCRIWATVGSRLGDVMLLFSGSDYLCSAPEMGLPALRAVARHLSQAHPRGSLLLVGRLTAESLAFSACQSFSGAVGYRHGAVDWISCTRPWPEVFHSLSRNFRASLRNTMNRARGEGRIDFAASYGGDGNFDHAFSDFLKVEATGWKAGAGGGSALISEPATTQREFIRAIFALKEGVQPVIHRMTFSGKCIAALLAIRYKSTVAVLKIGVDDSFRRFGPGHLLLQDLVKRSCEDRDISVIDLVAHNQWISRWNPEIKLHHWFYIPLRKVRTAVPLALLKLSRDRGAKT